MLSLTAHVSSQRTVCPGDFSCQFPTVYGGTNSGQAVAALVGGLSGGLDYLSGLLSDDIAARISVCSFTRYAPAGAHTGFCVHQSTSGMPWTSEPESPP